MILSGKEKRGLRLFTAILWYVCAGIWIAALCTDLYYGFTPAGLTVLHGVCIVTSLFAAVTSHVRYIRSIKGEEG